MITTINEFKMLKESIGIIVARDRNHLIDLIKINIKHFGKNCDLNYIDVSGIIDMHQLFYGSNFNGDISNWNVSNVKEMQTMFGFSRFNGDISNWNVSNVENMNTMFLKSDFTGDINAWNVSNVKSMLGIFQESKLEETNKLPIWYKE